MFAITDNAGPLRVYLAGPDVFFPNAIEIGCEKKRICAEHGFEGIFPSDNELPVAGLDKSEAANAIFRANCKAMDSADFVIANMMPFRGVSTDVGTAFEIGYAYSQGKPVFGYGSDGLSYLERVVTAGLARPIDSPWDRQGMHIEDFDLADNLMLVCAVRDLGFEIVRGTGPVDDISAFTKCVQLAADRLRHRAT
jgi:nucleoside 2-deoxyribosyltransferase